MVHGALMDDYLIQLKLVTGTLNAQKYLYEILESGVRSGALSLSNTSLEFLCDQNRFLPDLSYLYFFAVLNNMLFI